MSNGTNNNSNSLVLIAVAGPIIAALGLLFIPMSDSQFYLVSFTLLVMLASIGVVTVRDHKWAAMFAFLGFVLISYLIWEHYLRGRSVESAQTHYNRGEELYKQANFKDALSEFDQADHLKGDFMQAIKYKGKCCLMLKRFKEAEDAFQRVLNLAPSEAQVEMATLYGQWALEWCNSGNSREALRCIELARKFSQEVYNKLIGVIGKC